MYEHEFLLWQFPTANYSSTFPHLGWVIYFWKVCMEQDRQDWINERKSGRQMSYCFHKFKARLRGILTDLPQHILVNKTDWTYFCTLISRDLKRLRRCSTVFFWHMHATYSRECSSCKFSFISTYSRWLFQLEEINDFELTNVNFIPKQGQACSLLRF